MDAIKISPTSLAMAVAKERVREASIQELKSNTTLDQQPAKIVAMPAVTAELQQTTVPVQTTEETPTPMAEKSGTTYLEVNLPGANAPTGGTTPTTPTVTEDEKRKRTIIGATILLAAMVIVVVFVTSKKKK